MVLSFSYATIFVSLLSPGIQEGSRHQASTTTNGGNWGGHIGVRDDGSFDQLPMEGHVDEFKYYYRVLNPTGKYRVSYT